jgi:hypothetical protein
MYAGMQAGGRFTPLQSTPRCWLLDQLRGGPTCKSTTRITTPDDEIHLKKIYKLKEIYVFMDSAFTKTSQTTHRIHKNHIQFVSLIHNDKYSYFIIHVLLRF